MEELDDIKNWSEVANYIVNLVAENAALKLQNLELAQENEELRGQLGTEIDDLK